MHRERTHLGALSSAEGDRAWLAEAPAETGQLRQVLRVLLSILCLPRVVLPAGVLSELPPALQSLDCLRQQPAGGSPWVTSTLSGHFLCSLAQHLKRQG